MIKKITNQSKRNLKNRKSSRSVNEKFKCAPRCEKAVMCGKYSAFDGLTVGQKIIKACGEKVNGRTLYPIREKVIAEGIKETITLLKGSRFFSNKELKTPCIVQSLYILTGETTDQRQRVYNRATTQVIIEFLEWLLNAQALKRRLHKIRDLLTTFVFDLGSTGVLGEKFFSANCGRSSWMLSAGSVTLRLSGAEDTL